METALAALYRTIERRARSTGSELWDMRVYADRVPGPVESVQRPYLLFVLTGGGEINQVRSVDARFTVSIRGVADSMQQSMQMAARITALFNDQGTQDGAVNPLDAGESWTITTCTQERAIHIVEPFRGVNNIYHDGHVFEFVMGSA